MNDTTDTEIQSADLAKMEAVWSRWKRPVPWILITIALLLIYLLLYPLVFAMLENAPFETPEWLETGLEYSVAPLIYLDENVEIYGAYIDWLGKILGM